MKTTTAAWVAGLALVALGCGLVAGYDGVSFDRREGEADAGGAGAMGGSGGVGGATGGTGATAGAAGVGGATGGTGATGGAGGTSVVCNSLEDLYGPLQICVAHSVQIDAWFIDVTEVTNKQYKAWLTYGPDPENDSTCKYAPENPKFGLEPKCDGDGGQYNGDDDYPVACIDWCAASAYCKGVGKHLCGSIDGGSVLSEDYNKIAVSQWYRACTNGDADRYFPYPQAYDCQICNVTDEPSKVAQHGKCRTPLNIYDLSGNVGEWEDCCDKEKCYIRGGYYSTYGMNDPCKQDGTLLRCDTENTIDKGAKHPFIGFRCCTGP
mgnify:CR=1 FL=1